MTNDKSREKSETRMSKSFELRRGGFRHFGFVIPSDLVIRHSDLGTTSSHCYRYCDLATGCGRRRVQNRHRVVGRVDERIGEESEKQHAEKAEVKRGADRA